MPRSSAACAASCSTSAAAMTPAQAYEVFGRGSEAGRLLHSIYGSELGTSALGQSYSDRNRARTARSLASGRTKKWAPKEPRDVANEQSPLKLPMRPVPRVGRGQQRAARPKVDEISRRKPASVIRAEQAATRAQHQCEMRASAAATAAVTRDADGERQRLADAAELRGTGVSATQMERIRVNARAKVAERRQAAEQEEQGQSAEAAFDEIVAELDGLEADMDAMRRIGSLYAATEARLKGEISRKMFKMKQLDRQIKAGGG